MIVIDSCGWIAVLTNDPRSKPYITALSKPDLLIVPTVFLYEVYKWFLLHTERETALEVAARLSEFRSAELDQDTALLASELSVSYRLPQADSMALAVAQQHKAQLWTHDTHFKDIPGVKYFGD